MQREVAIAKLLNLKEYRAALIGMERAKLEPNGMMELHIRLPWGFLAQLHLAREWGEDENQLLFRSHGGNMELYGALAFAEIRAGLTEITLVMEYTIAAPMHRWMDRYRHGVETLVDYYVSAIETHFMRPTKGIRADKNLPSPMNGHHKPPGDS